VVVVTNTATEADLDPGEVLTATASCSVPTPTRIGGGAQASNSQTFINDSYPSGTADWIATLGSAVTNQNTTLTVYAICAP